MTPNGHVYHGLMDRQEVAIGWWARPELEARREQFVRVVAGRERACLLLANGALSGFERVAPTLSGTLLDAAEGAAHAALGAPQLDDCRDAVVSAMVAALKSLHTPDEEDERCAWFACAVVEPERLAVAWTGNEETRAYQRDKQAFLAAGHRVYPGGGHTFLTRGIGAAYGFENIDTASVRLESMSAVVMSSDSVSRALGPRRDAETSALQRANPHGWAQFLSELAGQTTHLYGAAIVARMTSDGE